MAPNAGQQCICCTLLPPSHPNPTPQPHPTWPLCRSSVPAGSAASATTARPRYSGVSLPASSGTPRQCCSSAGSATGIHVHVRAFALTSSCPALASSCAACCTMPFRAQRRRLYRHDARPNFRDYCCPRAPARTPPDYSLQFTLHYNAMVLNTCLC